MRPLAPALGLTFGLSLAFVSAPALYAQDPGPVAPQEAKDPAELSADLKLYRQGSIRLHKGDHAGAIQRFTELLEKHPKSSWASEARFWRASALEESGQRSAALEAYRALRKLSPASGWAKDAAGRIERLARTSSLGQLTCRVQLTEGKAFSGQLHELNSKGVLLSGGPFKVPTRVAFDRLVKLEVEKGAPQLLVLSNGDRVSGRLLSAEPKALVVDVPGLAKPLRLHPARLRELRTPGRAGVAWVGTGAEGNRFYGKAPHMGTMAFAYGDEDEAEVERETRVNPDGSRTTTTVDGAGRKTVTTVTRDGKGRKVMIKRGEGNEGATIELKLDGGVVGEALLGDLAGELPEGLGEQLDGIDFNMDLEIDDSELSELDEVLRELPAELRERIRRSLRGRKSRTKKRQRNRRVWVERGRGGEERVIILEGEDTPRRSKRHTTRTRGKHKKVIVVRGEGGDQEEVIILEGKGKLPARRIKKRVVIMDGDEEMLPSPRRQKRVMVFEGDDPHAHGPRDRTRKHLMVFEGRGDEDEVDVDVFLTPDGKKVVRERIRKRIRMGGEGGSFTFEGRGHDPDFDLHGEGDVEEDVDVFVTPDGKKVVRKVIRKGRKGSRFASPVENEFVFGGPDLNDESVYSWARAIASQTKDRVFLRNGDTLSGKIRSLNGEGLKLDTDYGKVTIRRDQIRQVTFATPKKPFLGVSMKATASGVEVTKVHEGTAAALAGLKTGDVIVQVGRERIQGKAPLTVETLGEEISKRRVGEVMHFLVRRGKELKVMEARLAERPHQVSTTTIDKLRLPGAHLERAKLHVERTKVLRVGEYKEQLGKHKEELGKHKAELGKHKAELRKHKAELRKHKAQLPGKLAKPAGKPRLGVALSEKEGRVEIAQVMEGSLAARMGLKVGDRIVKFQGRDVKSITDIAAGMKGLTAKGQLELEIARTKGNQIQIMKLKFTLE